MQPTFDLEEARLALIPGAIPIIVISVGIDRTAEELVNSSKPRPAVSFLLRMRPARDKGTPARFALRSRWQPGRMPPKEEPVTLSKQSLALFREHLEQRRTIDVDRNREAYRELARAGLMVAGSSFARGDESVYEVTKEGFELRAELLACAKDAG